MPNYISDAIRRALGIEYTGPPLVRRPRKKKRVRKNGHIVNQYRAANARKLAHLVHRKRR